MAREIVSGQLDPAVLEIGAGMTGLPAWLAHRRLSATGSTSEPSPVAQHSELPLPESSNTSGGEQ